MEKEEVNLPRFMNGPHNRLEEMFGTPRGLVIDSITRMLWHQFEHGVDSFSITFDFKPKDDVVNKEFFDCSINFSSEIKS